MPLTERYVAGDSARVLFRKNGDIFYKPRRAEPVYARAKAREANQDADTAICFPTDAITDEIYRAERIDNLHDRSRFQDPSNDDMLSVNPRIHAPSFDYLPKASCLAIIKS